MKTLFLIRLFFLLGFSLTVSAEELTIIAVRKNIPLSDTEPSYRDLYINGGTSQGFKIDQVYQVFRPSQVRDSSGSLAFGEILIPIGEIKILAAYDRVSIARDVKIYPRETYPTVEVFGTMSGDRLELIKK